MSKIIWWCLHFSDTQDYYGILHTFNHTIQFICVKLSLVRKETQHQMIYIEILYCNLENANNYSHNDQNDFLTQILPKPTKTAVKTIYT